MDAIDRPKYAPCLKCETRRDGRYPTNFFTQNYNLSRLGEWQELETVFTALVLRQP